MGKFWDFFCIFPKIFPFFPQNEKLLGKIQQQKRNFLAIFLSVVAWLVFYSQNTFEKDLALDVNRTYYRFWQNRDTHCNQHNS